MTTKLIAISAFGGEFGELNPTKDPELGPVLDPERAAIELREAGYEASLYPDEFKGRLVHPLDNFIEAVITVPEDDPDVISSVMGEVEDIVAKYGGFCDQCGPMEESHVPFEFRDPRAD